MELGGHIDVLKYLEGDDEEFVRASCEAGAEGGHIDVLKYL